MTSDRRRDNRRVRKLAQARARGDHDARVMWLLPPLRQRSRPGGWSPRFDDDPRERLRRSEDLTIWEHRGGMMHGSRYKLSWSHPLGFTQRCRPAPNCFPPAFEDRLRSLGDLYIVHRDADRLRRAIDAGPLHPVPSTAATQDGADREVSADREASADRVVADARDFDRWFEEGDAYRAELVGAETELNRYWTERGYRLGLASWRGHRALRRWQAMLAAAYDRIAAAADRYQPVLAEMTEAIQETACAYEELTARTSRLHDWEERRIWRMVSRDEGFLIRRSDVAGDEPVDAPAPRPFAEVYRSASSERDDNLHPVDWDEESLRRCDGELADLADANPPTGRTRSGLPMAGPAPTSFEAWFLERFTGRYQRLSDRAALERDRQLREQWRANYRDRGPSSPRIGGYHTDPGGHHGFHF